MKIRRSACWTALLLALVGAGCASNAVDPAPVARDSAPPPVAAAPPAEVAPAGTVARAVITSAVTEREPVDSLQSVSNTTGEVFFFTEIQNGEGQTLTHRWEYQGQVMAEIPLQVGSARWRTYSSKQLDPSWLGQWKVSVVDATGTELGSASFAYQDAGASPPASPPAASPAASPAPSPEPTPGMREIHPSTPEPPQ